LTGFLIGTEEKGAMRKSTQGVLIAALAVFVIATIVLVQQVRKTSAQYTAVKASEQETSGRYAEAINSIAEIQDSLSAIVLGDSAIRPFSGGLQAEQRLNQAGGREAMERIALLRAGIERAKGRIESLETRLKQNGVKIAGLQRMVAGLKRSVTQKEEMVASLTGRVDSLSTRVGGLETEVAANEDTIRTQQHELGTIFYVIGSKKDLTTAGVVVAKGGVLGVGKTLKPSGQFNENVFRPLDTDNENVVVIPSAKAQVLSAQPPTSYALQPMGNRLELRILDPKAFRMIKHLVIMTT